MDLGHNYIIVLFKNNEKKKIIKKYVSKDRALDFYNNMLDSMPIFGKRVENGKLCSFELGLLEKSSLGDFTSYFVRDGFGRQLRVDLDDPDYSIIKINSYEVEEFLYDVTKSKKISMLSFIKEYLPKNKIKLISKLNNKIVVQLDDTFNLFSLKTDFDCDRFLDLLENYLISKNRIDSIIVRDSTKEQKKYLYDILENYGISKSILYRTSTTFFKGE